LKKLAILAIIGLALLLSGCGGPQAVAPGTGSSTTNPLTGETTTTYNTGTGTVTTNATGNFDESIKACIPGKTIEWNYSGMGGQGMANVEWELIIIGKEAKGCHAKYQMVGSSGGETQNIAYDFYFDEEGEVVDVQMMGINQ